MHATALVAEDEPLLARALVAELAAAWPDLRVVATVGDGRAAVETALRLLPRVLFLDIRMPGLDGLGAAAELAERWPVDAAPLPQLVFVTAYDEYATRAFEAQALDYVLKPVRPERLRRTVGRLRQALAANAPPAVPPAPSMPSSAVALAVDEALERALARWRGALDAAGAAAAAGARAPTPLRLLPVGDAGGGTVRLVPIDEVLCFEAADKYVRVLTATHEHLIRTPLRQLLPRLDAEVFWQVHRAVVVRAAAIDSVRRDEAGRLHLTLRGRPGTLPVSRLHAHRFQTL
ncbi:LytR/AlgR family response regulator transcription factor [Variovorax sp. PvP013]|uniref:LytR/AlgR family response regulator transcription factor n=1 Tax=Variovorax sp. PvP013 TaxID=3156435 RepID=UPI003D242F19